MARTGFVGRQVHAIGAWASMYLMPQVALLYLQLTPYLSKPGLSQLPAALAAAGYQQKLAALEGLKKSLLHQVFNEAL